jgi:D-alanyl-lipoteichoic acid acyltransferase DltB (MBOAT superfamily)
MLFNNPNFFIFLLIIILLLLIGNKTYKKLILLISSYVFYGLWDWRFLSLIALSTIIDYLLGIQIDKTALPKKRKILLSISVVANLGILAFFKYYNFFIDSLQEFIFLFSDNSINYNTLNIILPVGISFYTFQTMSYTIDIYRKKLNPSNSILDFAIFVSFFPQLVAGPIERAKNLLHQIANFDGIKIDNLKNSFILFFTGYIQKVLIADNLAPISDNCFSNFNELDSIYLISGLIVFSFQIYFDFAGYSNIARGIARILGLNL